VDGAYFEDSVEGAGLAGNVCYGSEGDVSAGYGEDSAFGVDFGHSVAGFSFHGVFDAFNVGWHQE
jgi:hypothetical protein